MITTIMITIMLEIFSKLSSFEPEFHSLCCLRKIHSIYCVCVLAHNSLNQAPCIEFFDSKIFALAIVALNNTKGTHTNKAMQSNAIQQRRKKDNRCVGKRRF